MDAERYPVDFDTINKGTVIDPDTIEGIYGIKRTDAAYSLKAMRLAKKIEEELENRGLYVTACVADNAVCVLTDSEASEYNYASAMTRFRGMVRAHSKLSTVDTSEFEPKENATHTRKHVVLGAMISGAVQGRKQGHAQLTAHKRNTPGLPKPDAESL